MLLAEYGHRPLPRWRRVRQRLDHVAIGDVAAAVRSEFARPEVGEAVFPGARVCIGCSSRGIDRYAEVIRTLVQEVKHRGGLPFLIPAMGSHGGATVEGQLALMARHGLTEAAMDCPVRATMETVRLGEVAGNVPVYFDRIAATEADIIIPVNRVKPHTDFRGPVESGLLKMLAIGFGKQFGASFFHEQGYYDFAELIPVVGRFSLTRVPVAFGVALIENGYGALREIEAVPAPAIWEREQVLLERARTAMARLPVAELDVLIVDHIGKDISGAGMDPNVTNRYPEGGPLSGAGPVKRIFVRHLTPDTGGSAVGLGLADVTLQSTAARVDPAVMYINAVTARMTDVVRIPMSFPNDRIALGVALATCNRTDPARACILRIRDTKHLEEMYASEELLPDLLKTGRVDLLDEPHPIVFTADGMLGEALD